VTKSEDNYFSSINFQSCLDLLNEPQECYELAKIFSFVANPNFDGCMNFLLNTRGVLETNTANWKGEPYDRPYAYVFKTHGRYCIEKSKNFRFANNPHLISCAKAFRISEKHGIAEAIFMGPGRHHKTNDKDFYAAIDKCISNVVGLVDQKNGSSGMQENKKRRNIYPFEPPITSHHRACAMVGLWKGRDEEKGINLSQKAKEWIELSVISLRATLGDLKYLNCSSLDKGSIYIAVQELISEVKRNEM